MSTEDTKPWMRPCIYNDDRFVESAPASGPGPGYDDAGAPADERDARDIEEILRRPDRREDKEYACTDQTPLDYRKGPHDTEFGVDEKDFDEPDPNPVPYDNQPHDTEFGVDEDELEPLDENEEEFPDE